MVQVQIGQTVVAKVRILDGEIIHAEPGEQGTVLAVKPGGLTTVIWHATDTVLCVDAATELEIPEYQLGSH